MICASVLGLLLCLSPAGSPQVELLQEDTLREVPPEPEDSPAQKVEIIRFSDKVTVREGTTGKETVLLYPNKRSLLQEGDKVIQGSGGQSECNFQNQTRVMFFGRGRYHFGELSQSVHIVKVDEFSRLHATVKEDLTLILPGGTRLEATFGESYLYKEGNLIRIRNAGPMEIKLKGHLVKEEHEVVPSGHSISIPLFDPELIEELEPIVVREVSGVIVKTTGGYRMEEKPGFLVISRPTADEGLARIGGSRIFLYPGEKVIFRFP